MGVHDPSRTGAVVIGGDYQGLAIVRSLGRRGIPVVVLDDEYSIGRFSRYAERGVRVASLKTEDETVGALLGLADRYGLHGWVLFPTRDETVAAIARRRDELQRAFRVPTPGWDTVRWATDKRNTYRLARELDVPVPRTWHPETLEELEEVDADPPLVLKPAVKPRFLHATKAKAWRADSREELRELFARATEVAGPGEMIVQELVPGDGRNQYAYCAFFKRDRALGTMVARRRRQHPPEFGRSSTFVETVDAPPVRERSERLLREIGYYGLVEVEYKQDPRDGEYKLLDFNARTWGYHGIGAQAGVDFPWLLFADQTGRDASVCHTSPGVSWMRVVTDLPTAALEVGAGNLDWREWARSLRDLDAEATFSLEDPLPLLAELALLPYLYVKRGY